MQICIEHAPSWVYFVKINVRKNGLGFCAFPPAITGRYRWIYVQGFDIRQRTAPLNHVRSPSHVSAIDFYTNWIAFLTDSHRFCLNYPDILCIIQYKSPSCIHFCKTKRTRNVASLTWPDLLFVQGNYRFQYKCPVQKGSGTLPLAYLCQPPSETLEPHKCRTSTELPSSQIAI